MNEYEYYNVDDNKRNTVRSDKPWSELPHSKANIILIKTTKIDEPIESFNPNIAPPEKIKELRETVPEKKHQEEFRKHFESKNEAYVTEPEMRFLKICKLCGQTVDGNLREHIDTHEPISPLFYFSVVPELTWD